LRYNRARGGNSPMATVSTIPVTEVALLDRLFGPPDEPISAAAARALLKVNFTADDRDRMQYLAARARAGTLSAKELGEISSYERVGHLLDLLHSRARRALKKRNGPR
jgi:hypothetical protein